MLNFQIRFVNGSNSVLLPITCTFKALKTFLPELLPFNFLKEIAHQNIILLKYIVHILLGISHPIIIKNIIFKRSKKISEQSLKGKDFERRCLLCYRWTILYFWNILTKAKQSEQELEYTVKNSRVHKNKQELFENELIMFFIFSTL